MESTRSYIYQTGNTTKAITANIKSIKLNPKSEAYSNLGNIYRELVIYMKLN